MAKKIVNLEAQTVEFTFGEAGSVLFELSKCSPEMLVQLALHGASQKGGDSYASASKTCDGTEADPIEWSMAQVAGVVEQVYNDDWTVRTPGSAAVTDLATALSEAVGCTIEEAVAKVSEIDADQKKALRAHPDVAAVLARIKAERAAAKAETAAKKTGSGPDLTALFA
jgi:hypothetical protein